MWEGTALTEEGDRSGGEVLGHGSLLIDRTKEFALKAIEGQCRSEVQVAKKPTGHEPTDILAK